MVNLKGQNFGRLTVISEAGRNKRKNVLWLCLCECGNQKIIASDKLRTGHTKSCGCLLKEILIKRNLTPGRTGTREKVTTHGQTKNGKVTSIYTVWWDMKQRCANPNSPGYKNYGGRGIVVCARWNDFKNFFFDMGDKPKELTLERIDNNKGYSPDNCKWATRKEQNRNSRKNHMIKHQGKTLCISEWAEIFGIKYHTLWMRLKRGHSPEKAFNAKIHERL